MPEHLCPFSFEYANLFLFPGPHGSEHWVPSSYFNCEQQSTRPHADPPLVLLYVGHKTELSYVEYAIWFSVPVVPQLSEHVVPSLYATVVSVQHFLVLQFLVFVSVINAHSFDAVCVPVSHCYVQAL